LALANGKPHEKSGGGYEPLPLCDIVSGVGKWTNNDFVSGVENAKWLASTQSHLQKGS
jgi:hypothetical protein